jgi:glyoxylase-like metal-dependent hydrolase (beta-lactamase superfamily II)
VNTPNIVVRGKDNGEDMVVHYRTTAGTHVFGLGMPNVYIGTDWDLGPTWCYFIDGQKTTLIDTGRFGNFDKFKTLLKSAGKELTDIDRIIITHSHEDHDGNLADILSAAKAELWAHSIYSCMISYHPHIDDGARHPELPGSCRLCHMPAEFNRNCATYHKNRSMLTIDYPVDSDWLKVDNEIALVFTPGHSPDAICAILEDEVVFSGDTILPDITPHPSLASGFNVNCRILPEGYSRENTVYGLINYIKSLNRLASLDVESIRPVFPGHRLFYNGRFNLIHSCSGRAREIIRFHIDRCSDILKILQDGPAGVDEIAVRHFPESQLDGAGKTMAHDEIMAHLEVLEACGDIRWTGEKRDVVRPTGTTHYLSILNAYLP